MGIQKQIFFVFLLISLLNFIPVQPQSQLSQSNEYGVTIVWVVDTFVIADRFPVVIFENGYYQGGKTLANLTFETSYTKFNITPAFNSYEGEIIWVEVPPTQSGEDELIIYADGDIIGNYSFMWSKNDEFTSDLSYVTYTYNWFSYWIGSSNLEGSFYENNGFEIIYEQQSSDMANPKPFDNDFDIKGTYDFDSIKNQINISDIHKYQSWMYNSPYGMCDGGGYSQQVSLGFGNQSVDFSSIIDNDSCSGRRSIHSDPEIQKIINTLNSTTFDLIMEKGTETKAQLPIQFVSIFAFVVLIIFKRKFSQIKI